MTTEIVYSLARRAASVGRTRELQLSPVAKWLSPCIKRLQGASHSIRHDRVLSALPMRSSQDQAFDRNASTGVDAHA